MWEEVDEGGRRVRRNVVVKISFNSYESQRGEGVKYQRKVRRG